MSEIISIIGNATMAHTNMDVNFDSKQIVESFFELIKEDSESIKKANKIDIKNNNGFEIDFPIVDELKESFLKLDDNHRRVISMTEDKKNNYIYGSQLDKLGTICLIYDGNTYNLIEIMLKCILTHNAIIIASESDYMKGTNELIVILLQRILKTYKIDINIVQLIYTKEFDKLLKNNASINKVIVLGNNDLQQKVKKTSKIETVYIGYGEYDLYIDDNTNIELIEKIIQKDNNINLYIKEGIKCSLDNCFYVKDVNEAIGQINFNTAGYSSSIFTTNNKNAIQFLRDIKTENIAVNASPISEKFANVNLNLLQKSKNLYYPNPLKEDEKNNKFEFPTERAVLEKKYNNKKQKEIDNLKNENSNLKATSQEIEKSSSMKIDEKEKEIQELKRQLSESQQLVNKYIKIFQKSTFSRIFGKLSKEDIEKDMKLLS